MAENQHTEFKRQWKDEYLRWIAGFANAEGGVLLLGVDDSARPVGVRNAARLLEDIPNKVRDVLGMVVDVNLLERDGIEVIEIRVEPYPYPISYKGEYHYRTGSTKQELKGAALDRFLLRKQGLHWDGVPLPGLNEADLDTSVLRQFRQLSVKSQRLPEQVLEDSDKILLERLRLFSGDYLKRAAALLFHPDPEHYITGAFLKVGYFGRDHADLRYQDEVHGDLFRQVDGVLEILKLKYLKAMISYDGLYREENYPIPIPALREALLNAVVHKDYASSIPVQISVYPDKLMIWNPGVLPDDWTLDDLMAKHASKPFNPDIANAFFRAGLIESWGRGIERIVHACQEVGYPVPEWKLETAGLWTVFHFPASYLQQLDNASGLTTGQATGQVTGQVEQWVADVLAECAVNDLSSAEIQAIVGIKHRETFQRNYLDMLLNKGMLERTIPDKPKSPKQKYRITAKGRQLL